MGLGDGEHGHEAAVAPAGDADAVGIDGILGQDGIDAGEDVAEVAVAEVLAVGLGEGLALAEAAAGIGHENEVAEGGKGSGAEAAGAAVPAGSDGRGGTAVDFDEERIFLRRIVVRGQQEPALNVEAVVGPGERNGIAPGGLEAVVEVGELDEARGVGRVDGAGTCWPGGVKISGGALKLLAWKTKRERSAVAERLVRSRRRRQWPGKLKTGASKMRGVAALVGNDAGERDGSCRRRVR